MEAPAMASHEQCMSVGVPDVAFDIDFCEAWNEPGTRVESAGLASERWDLLPSVPYGGGSESAFR
jgi:hypothetical protein